jgi:hypothetical protein
MDGVPNDLGKSIKKDKAFDVEPFKSAIIEILKANPGCNIIPP